MIRYLSILVQIFPWQVLYFLGLRRGDQTQDGLPRRINGFHLVKNLSQKNFTFATGLYENDGGKRAVIKVWDRKLRSVHYFSLLHQIESMKTLTEVQERLARKKHHPFSMPKYLQSQKNGNKLVLVMEEATGKPLSKIHDPLVQWKIYQQCLEFLEDLSQECTAEERKQLTIKNAWDFLFLYPLLLTTALAMHPRLTPLLLRGIPIFLAGLPPLFKRNPNRLVHGDLHPDNILVNRNKCFLLDIEAMRFCYPEYEPITTISLKGNSAEFKKIVVEKLIKPVRTNSIGRKIMATLMVNNSTHNISGDEDNRNIPYYLDVFNMALNHPANI